MTEREAFELGYMERKETWPFKNLASANFQNPKFNKAYALGVKKYDDEHEEKGE